MSVPSLPALSFQVKSTAGASLAAWLDAHYTNLGSATDDSAVSIATNAIWPVTRHQTAGTTDAVYCEPAASSPIAGKIVLIWAGAAGTAPNASAMASPDTAATNGIYFGMWVATAGNTVSRSDYSDWSAAAPFTGTGRFTGYIRLQVGLATIQDAFTFMSAEYIVTQLMTTTSTTSYVCGGGFGISGLSDSATNGESGLGGRIADFFCSGSGTAISASFWSSATAATGLFTHATGASQTHSFYLIPGTSTLGVYRYRDNGGNSAFNNSSANNCYGIDGATIKPAPMALRNNNSFYVGDHRAIFFGPQKTSKSVLSDGGTVKWIAVGHSVTTQGDCFLMPKAT